MAKVEEVQIIIMIMSSFMCYFSRLDHIVHYKARNQNTVKTNFCEHTRIRMCTNTHAHTQALCLYKAKYAQLKTGSKSLGDLEWIKMHGTENMAGLQFWENKCF